MKIGRGIIVSQLMMIRENGLVSFGWFELDKYQMSGSFGVITNVSHIAAIL